MSFYKILLSYRIVSKAEFKNQQVLVMSFTILSGKVMKGIRYSTGEMKNIFKPVNPIIYSIIL